MLNSFSYLAIMLTNMQLSGFTPNNNFFANPSLDPNMFWSSFVFIKHNIFYNTFASKNSHINITGTGIGTGTGNSNTFRFRFQK